MSAFLKIVGLSTLAAIGYGVIHDQITARLCVEYFTVGHPPVFRTHDPTLLGLGWGIIGTWWVGLILGLLLAWAARRGEAPRTSVRALVQPLLITLAITGVVAIVAGIAGNLLATAGIVRLSGSFTERVPAEKHAAFIAALCAHSTSYAGGAVGGITLCVMIIRNRRRMRTPAHSDRPGITSHCAFESLESSSSSPKGSHMNSHGR